MRFSSYGPLSRPGLFESSASFDASRLVFCWEFLPVDPGSAGGAPDLATRREITKEPRDTFRSHAELRTSEATELDRNRGYLPTAGELRTSNRNKIDEE